MFLLVLLCRDWLMVSSSKILPFIRKRKCYKFIIIQRSPPLNNKSLTHLLCKLDLSVSQMAQVCTSYDINLWNRWWTKSAGILLKLNNSNSIHWIRRKKNILIPKILVDTRNMDMVKIFFSFIRSYIPTYVM